MSTLTSLRGIQIVFKGQFFLRNEYSSLADGLQQAGD
jgi:hypothetical protein